MKPFLLLSFFFFAAFAGKAQNISLLPAGKYETKNRVAQNKWEKGDIILLNDTAYKLSGSNETGEYRFSVAAQRVFFISGPLKSAYTKVISSNNKPVIVFPTDQNSELGLTMEIWASKQ